MQEQPRCQLLHAMRMPVACTAWHSQIAYTVRECNGECSKFGAAITKEKYSSWSPSMQEAILTNRRWRTGSLHQIAPRKRASLMLSTVPSRMVANKPQSCWKRICLGWQYHKLSISQHAFAHTLLIGERETLYGDSASCTGSRRKTSNRVPVAARGSPVNLSLQSAFF